jgi:hypothetical protein
VLTAASFAISTAGAVATYMGQVEQAEATADYQQRVMEMTQKNAEKAYRQEVSQIDRRITEEREAAAQKQTVNAIEAAKARSRARVSAGESGVAGISVDALMADFNRQEAVYRAGVQDNLKRFTDQAQMEKVSSRTRKQSRVNSTYSQMRPVSKPSFLQPVAQTASSGMDSYRNYLAIRPPGNTSTAGGASKGS